MPAGTKAAADLDPARAHTLRMLRDAVGRIEGDAFERLATPAIRAGAGTKERECGPRRDRADPFRPLGAPEADRMLGGGFPASGLTEIRIEAVRDGGAGTGFALALAVLFGACVRRPLLWIAAADTLREAGFPYAPGLQGFGLDPRALVAVRTRRLEEAAWAGEEAARSGALALTVLEVRGNPALLSLEGTRRLHARARQAGGPVLLLRQGARAETTVAPLRLHLSPGPAAAVPDLDDLDLIGRPVFSLAIEKGRGLRPDRLALEWDPHDRRFLDCSRMVSRPVPAAAGDGPDPARAPRSLLAFQGRHEPVGASLRRVS